MATKYPIQFTLGEALKEQIQRGRTVAEESATRFAAQGDSGYEFRLGPSTHDDFVRELAGDLYDAADPSSTRYMGIPVVPNNDVPEGVVYFHGPLGSVETEISSD